MQTTVVNVDTNVVLERYVVVSPGVVVETEVVVSDRASKDADVADTD